MKGLCPFNKLRECDEKCVLYRKGIRYREDNTPPTHFEECAINIACDCLENLVSRNIGLQQEMNHVRNSSDKVAQILAIGLKNSMSINQGKIKEEISIIEEETLV